jgi:hypothetical protein
VIVKRPSWISNKKFSKIGTIGLVEITPFMAEICFNNADEDTKNFIVLYLGLAFKS